MKTAGIALIILLMTCLPLSRSSAQPAPETGQDYARQYNEANALYGEGRFDEALSHYESLMESGIENPDLYYNASNAAYRTNDLGKAMLYLERAANLAPSDEDIEANLAFLRSIREDQEPPETNPVAAFLSETYDRININEAAWWAALSFAIALSCATAALFTASWKRVALFALTGVFGFLFLLAGGVQLHKLNRAASTTEAIIMIDEAPAYSGPGEENTHIFTIHEGMKVAIDRSSGEWNLIRLHSGVGGWIRASAMEKI